MQTSREAECVAGEREETRVRAAGGEDIIREESDSCLCVCVSASSRLLAAAAAARPSDSQLKLFIWAAA